MKCEDRSLESLQSEDLYSASHKATASKPIETSSNVCREFLRCVYMEEDDDKPLEMLFHRFVAPVLDKLTTEEIVIIPDGPLFTVPFAALRDPETGNFLCETKRLRLAPSLTTLKILQESSVGCTDLIGDPAVGEVIYRGIEREIYPLSGARDEAIEIGKLLGVEPLIGEKATKEAVLSKLQQGVCVIHFAAHGSARNGEIFLAPSKPSLSSTTTPEEKDYILTVKEAQESGIRAQLVVLSCCHSGRGDIKAEGVVGMTRAFLAARARAVIASLWAIDDQATKLFMVKFYSHLKKGESASRSLKQAMKDVRETDEYKEPMYWAAFFLIATSCLPGFNSRLNRYKALLVCERGRGRALRDLLSLKYNTTGKIPSNKKALELDDVKKVPSSVNSCIIFYDLHHIELTTRFWVISSRSSIFVYDEIAELEALEKIISNLSQDEETNIENLYLKHLVEDSFLHMNVREKMKCEDRSLESLQSEDDLYSASY
ncbi:Tetratricopeptide repeat protein 28 [Exaiptasia diaphana]|nr:Tetratricopeptide repeat protein 28 [Exaiptasia diaphana]